MAVKDRPHTLGVPEALIRGISGSDAPWIVILFNDDVHTFDEVARQLMKAIGCTLSAGYAIAHQVHTTGSARVYEGDLEDCERVAAVLEEIHLRIKLQVV